MSDSDRTQNKVDFLTSSIEASIRIAVLFAIVLWCVFIIKPFFIPALWGAIIAVALYPFFERVRGWLGGRNGWAATLLTLGLLTLLIYPAAMLSGSIIDSASLLAEGWQSGSIYVPPPPSEVADWPIVGDKIYQLWALASENLASAAELIGPQLMVAASGFLGLLASAGGAVLFTVIAIIIAGAFLATADQCVKGIDMVAVRFAGEQGSAFVSLSGGVIKSVATGVLGVAAIQAMLGGIGMVLADIPMAGLWTLLLLILAIVQIPAILVMGPAIAYVFSASDTTTAIIFMIWGIFVTISDGILKPMLLGRGISTPTLVILLGAIGGMMFQGIIGLFVGAVVLAVGYELLLAWLGKEVKEPENAES